jgi:hypothetical protein
VETIMLAAMMVGADDAKAATMTVYNDGFAVVREPVKLDLKAGVNDVRFSGVTSSLEAESVLLRDPAGKTAWQIQEQSYRADAATKQRLLEQFEGKTIEFEDRTEHGVRRIRGKIVRAGAGAGNNPNADRVAVDRTIIEVDGKLQFGLPGNPLFPSLGDDAILKPTLFWKIAVDQPVQTNAELSYITRGLDWRADYNAVVSDKDDGPAEFAGMVTINNNTGKSFPSVGVKLVSGSIRKVEQQQPPRPMARGRMGGAPMMAMAAAPEVAERTFDEYHLYTLPRPVSLRDDGAKQLEFLRGSLKSLRSLYVLDERQFTQDAQAEQHGQPETLKVAVHREFDNSAANGLGKPIPKGKIRFHRRDADGLLEFLGEAEVNHTPVDRPVKVPTGHAFDLYGKRRLVDQQMRNNRLDRQTIEVTVGNRKRTPATIRIIERSSMGVGFIVLEKSHDFTQVDAQTIRFDVSVPAGGEVKVTYQVEYRWQ